MFFWIKLCLISSISLFSALLQIQFFNSTDTNKYLICFSIIFHYIMQIFNYYSFSGFDFKANGSPIRNAH